MVMIPPEVKLAVLALVICMAALEVSVILSVEITLTPMAETSTSPVASIVIVFPLETVTPLDPESETVPIVVVNEKLRETLYNTSEPAVNVIIAAVSEKLLPKDIVPSDTADRAYLPPLVLM